MCHCGGKCNNGGGHACSVAGEISLPFSQYCYKTKTAFKKAFKKVIKIKYSVLECL